MLIYEKSHEVTWIKDQHNPFFICISKPKDLSIELYSTWNMLNGFLARRADKIVLVPGKPDDNYQQVTTLKDQSEQTIPLGRPILRISVQDTTNEQTIRRHRVVLREWIELDRENIVNRSAGMHWVVGPTEYETNKSWKNAGQLRIAFYWNAKNLAKCRQNLGRTATALRLTIQKLGSQATAEAQMTQQIHALEHVLTVHSDYLEPLAKKALDKHIKLTLS